ncbi:hypothetical protein PYW07_001667 [Mythimna separata]|uniref:CCHC-type domain-containing protein n=1 Tax=Mythimna separata TaxID=271217 RepID=A0AAD8DWA2_MYTSE|nr:hypothetical protein PYW07_001667 [Mythimna separata]
MDSSPFNRSGLTQRSPPPTPTPTQPQQPSRERAQEEEKLELVSTPEIQNWLSSIEQHLAEVCAISSEGKLNSEQKLKISNLCRKVGYGVSQLAVKYQSLKSNAVMTHNSLKILREDRDLRDCVLEVNRTIKESCGRQATATSSFADMVKKGSNSFVRPNTFSSVAIYPRDNTKTSDETKNIVQKIVCPSEMKLKVRGVRKIGKGGLIISTETKEDLDKLKKTVQLASSGLTIDDPQKRKPRIIVLGVPASLAENEVFNCIYDQNLTDKLPTMTKDAFLTSIKLSHKSGRKDAENCNYIIEVPASIRKALIVQDRLFVNWTSCPVRDFTLVTRCYKCQQYGHAAKTCKVAAPTCGHCGEEGHTTQDCTKKADTPKCATCLRFKKPANHKTGDPECPAKKSAENRYINSIDYEGA